jgi:hypothetical protein
MKRKLLLRSLAASILLISTATVINAQDAQNPWHLAAYEDDREVAFYNVEKIVDVTATAQNVAVKLDNGKQFTHPITAAFGFDPRKAGTGTTNEIITVPQWSVACANGSLNFSESVSNVAVYSMTGAW